MHAGPLAARCPTTATRDLSGSSSIGFPAGTSSLCQEPDPRSDSRLLPKTPIRRPDAEIPSLSPISRGMKGCPDGQTAHPMAG